MLRVPVMHAEPERDTETVGDEEYEPEGDATADAV